jgi:hypothetical protein
MNALPDSRGSPNSPALRDFRDAAAQAFASGLRSAEAAQGLAAFARKQPAPWTLSDKDTI